MKTCANCHKRKSFEEFARTKANKDGYYSYCNACKKIKDHIRNSKREYYHDADRSRKNVVAKFYGLSIQGVKELFDKAGYKCQVCGQTTKLQIDHNHATGVVRGVLCYRCNSTLGFVEDSIELLEQLVKYLQQAPKGINLLGLLNQLSRNGGI